LKTAEHKYRYQQRAYDGGHTFVELSDRFHGDLFFCNSRKKTPERLWHLVTEERHWVNLPIN
jgi:hypothetical protein